MRTLTEAQVRKMLASAIEEAGGQRGFGREHDLGAPHIGRVLAGAKLSPAILDALGLEVAETVTTYRRKRK